LYVLLNRKSLHNRDYLNQQIAEAGRQGSPASFRRAVGVKFVEFGAHKRFALESVLH